MFFFLGLVQEDNMKKGIIQPSYVLGKVNLYSDTTLKTGLQVVSLYENKHVKKTHQTITKVLVTDPLEHPQLQQQVGSHKRVRRFKLGKNKGEKITRCRIRGGLFYFECDEYGKPTGFSIFVSKTPMRVTDERRKEITKFLSDKTQKCLTLVEGLTKAPSGFCPLECKLINFCNFKQETNNEPDSNTGKHEDI